MINEFQMLNGRLNALGIEAIILLSRRAKDKSEKPGPQATPKKLFKRY